MRLPPLPATSVENPNDIELDQVEEGNMNRHWPTTKEIMDDEKGGLKLAKETRMKVNRTDSASVS